MFRRELSTHWIIAVRNNFNTMTTGLPFFILKCLCCMVKVYRESDSIMIMVTEMYEGHSGEYCALLGVNSSLVYS